MEKKNYRMPFSVNVLKLSKMQKLVAIIKQKISKPKQSLTQLSLYTLPSPQTPPPQKIRGFLMVSGGKKDHRCKMGQDDFST